MKKFYLFVSALTFICLLSGCSKDSLDPDPTPTPGPGTTPIQLSSEKNIIEFKFLKSLNPSLDKDYVGTIVDNAINFNVIRGIDISNLKASFQVSAKANLKISNSIQENGITLNNFSNAITYTVTAEDNSMKNYTVSITVDGIVANLEINKTTSYYLYTQNVLYTDLKNVMPVAPNGAPYDPVYYNSRAYYDFDKDGDIDVMAASYNYPDNVGLDVEYYKNNGGTFVKDQSVFGANIPKYVQGRKAIIGDFDKNGWMDVVIAGTGVDKDPFPGETAQIIFNNNGHFTSQTLPLPAGFYHSVCAGDIDNDGDIDLFFTNNFTINKFLINNGSGSFTYDESIFPSSLSNKTYFTSELYDINNDGYLDLVSTGHEEANWTDSVVLWGDASGKYSENRKTVLPTVQYNGVVVDVDFMDFNSDGKTDIILNRTGDGKGSLAFYQGYYIQFLKNDGSNFTDVSSTAMPNNKDTNAKWINWLRVWDVDKDGDLDITSDEKWYNLEWKNNNGSFAKKYRSKFYIK